MLSTSTLSILKCLSLSELKRFGDFVKSPYHNSTSSIEIIFDAVLKSYPDFNSKALSYENMAKKIFPEGENKEKRIKNLYAEFGNLLRKFLGYEEMNHKLYELEILIAEGLSRKSLFEDSEKFIKKSLEQNDNGLITDNIKFFYKQRMDRQLEYNLLELGERGSEKVIEANRSQTESMIILLIKSIYGEAQAYSLYNNFRRDKVNFVMSDAFIESFNFDIFLNKLNLGNNKYHSYLKINLLLYYYTSNDITEVQYSDLKNEILKTIHFVEKWEAYSFISRINDILILRLSKIKENYSNEVFEFCKLFCFLKIFPNKTQDFINIGDFCDMFMTAIKIKEYDWAEKFVNEYIQYLSAEHKDIQYNYCNGILSFKRCKYEDSLNFFNKVNDEYIMIKINTRFYYLMNYIELKAYESARAAIHAFKQFYKDNDEIPEEFRSGIPESLKYLNEIIKCEEEGKKIDDFIYNEAHNGKRFYHAIYIRDKMEKLR